jgi:hypothetical protein
LAEGIRGLGLTCLGEPKNPLNQHANYLREMLFLFGLDFNRFGFSGMVYAESYGVDSIGIATVAIASARIHLDVPVAFVIGLLKTSFAQNRRFMGLAIVTPES